MTSAMMEGIKIKTGSEEDTEMEEEEKVIIREKNKRTAEEAGFEEDKKSERIKKGKGRSASLQRKIDLAMEI